MEEKRHGAPSTPLFIIHTGFFLHFPLEPSYGYLSFEGNILWEGRENGGEREGLMGKITKYPVAASEI